MDYLDWVERNWPLLGRLIPGHTAIYRASRGLAGHRVPGAPPMLLLDHVGAKLKTYRGYADYQRRTERQIPLVILEPR